MVHAIDTRAFFNNNEKVIRRYERTNERKQQLNHRTPARIAKRSRRSRKSRKGEGERKKKPQIQFTRTHLSPVNLQLIPMTPTDRSRLPRQQLQRHLTVDDTVSTPPVSMPPFSNFRISLLHAFVPPPCE